MRRESLQRDDIAGVGIGFPGVVHPNGVVAKAPIFSSQFIGINLPRVLRRILKGMDVFAASAIRTHVVGLDRFGDVEPEDQLIAYAAALVEQA